MNINIGSFSALKEVFHQYQAWGILTSLDMKYCDADLIRSAEAIKQYVIELCELIKMKRYGECTIVHFGEDEKVAGYSMVQLIETSLISGHFANLTNHVYIDIFSCKEYDPYQAAKFTQQSFKAEKYEINVHLRK